MKSMKLSILVLAVAIQAQDRTPTGFFYPTGKGNVRVSAGFLALGCNGAAHYTTGDYHLGADIRANAGDSVYAISDGTVMVKSFDGWEAGNVGLLVKHTLVNGTEFYAIYGHIHTTLNAGDPVTAGAAFATVGVVSTGNHLHFGIHPGLDVPSTYWGRIPCSLWPNTNGLIEPISWINTQHPRVNFAHKQSQRHRKKKKSSTGLPMIRGLEHQSTAIWDSIPTGIQTWSSAG